MSHFRVSVQIAPGRLDPATNLTGRFVVVYSLVVG